MAWPAARIRMRYVLTPTELCEITLFKRNWTCYIDLNGAIQVVVVRSKPGCVHEICLRP